MKNYKKIFLGFAVFILLILSQTASIVAITSGDVVGPKDILPGGKSVFGSSNDPKATKLVDIISLIIQYTYYVFFAAATFLIILAAYHYLTAFGEPEKISAANKQLIWAAIAIVVALLSVGFNKIIESMIKSS